MKILQPAGRTGSGTAFTYKKNASDFVRGMVVVYG